jgi:hypothetical protein
VPNERQKLQGSYLLLYQTAFMHSSSLSFFYFESHSTLNNKTTVVQIEKQLHGEESFSQANSRSVSRETPRTLR